MEELTFSDGNVDVVVLPEAGARIHRLRAFGHDVLRTPADPAEMIRLVAVAQSLRRVVEAFEEVADAVQTVAVREG